ncbi:MAG: hypothetical protein AAF985_25515, partial [Bacteroidota bacterium]
AGTATDWETYFKLKDYPRALADLEKLIANTDAPQPKLYYFAGILHLYLAEGKPQKAIDYLLLSDTFRNDEEYDFSKHLILAYAQNNNYTAAKLLLEKYPVYQRGIPPAILERINNK